MRALGSNKHSKPIIEVIVSLARCLGMSSIAEGVETEEQLATLTSIGCAEAQGYLFSKPKPLHELLELLPETSRRKSKRADDNNRSSATSPAPSTLSAA